MISISHLKKSYDGGRSFSVDDLSLDIKAGEIFGLLGPNGAGKSTLLNTIAGILYPDSGQISIEGIDTQENPMLAKTKFCYMSDSPDHLLDLKAIDYLRFIADVYNVPENLRIQRIDLLSREFGMEKELDNRMSTFSHGMRQKMMVIGALLPNPDNWILDEPMTGLDPRAAFTLKTAMRRHADQGKTVVFSTHVLDVAEKIVDRVGVISHGKLLFVGTVEEMRDRFADQGSLEEIFLQITGDEDVVSSETIAALDGDMREDN